MPGGVVTWSVYEGFQIGEKESNLARNAFETFIPIGADSAARKNIIFDFYDLLAAVAAHGKNNGLGGRKVSRLAGWWAFEHSDDGKGFEGGYKSWAAAADASTHLFFAYLRTLSPEEQQGLSLIERIPRSLQALLASTEYPPETPTVMQKPTPRVVMLVDSVSPTPFSLLRRAKHFEYRDNDRTLREFSEFEDPLEALTYECKRVLYAISTTNTSAARSRHHNATTKTDEAWSSFQNTGFGDMDDRALQKGPNGVSSSGGRSQASGLRSEPRSRNVDHARPTTPSWADFLSSGFAEDDANKTSTTLLLPPDKQLPPIGSRVQTPSYIPQDNDNLAPGELAAITNVNLDDTFWWVWMTSLAGEEPAERKAVFGRCAVIETDIRSGKWLIMEEQVKGASPDPVEGAYIAKKKGFFSTFTKRGKLGRKRSTGKPPVPPQPEPLERVSSATPSKSSLAPDQQSKIKQAAAELKRQETKDEESTIRRGRHDDAYSTKTNSMLTMGLQSEAGPAMKWTNAYDKDTIRKQYLGDAFAGRGMSRENLLFSGASSTNLNGDRASSVIAPPPALSPDGSNFPTNGSNRELPALPKDEEASAGAETSTSTRPEFPPTTTSTAFEDDAPPSDKEDTRIETQKESAAVQPTSAAEKEIAVDMPSSARRKPVPRPIDHPAYRQTGTGNADAVPQNPTSPKQNVAAIAAQKAMSTSPTSPTYLEYDTGHNKLKKQSGGGGLKKLFGRKKDNPNRQSIGTNNLAPPQDQSVGRKRSLMRKKPTPTDSPKDSQVTVPHHPDTPELEGAPVMPDSHGQYEYSTTNVSNIDPQERRDAEEEFARFDQGPIDMPAATPQSSQPDIAAPQAQRPFNVNESLAVREEEPDDEQENFVHRDYSAEDAQSEATMEEDQQEQEPVDAKDRWAIIRENAARRAARASEDQDATQSRPSQGARTDDGETSGEESTFNIYLS